MLHKAAHCVWGLPELLEGSKAQNDILLEDEVLLNGTCLGVKDGPCGWDQGVVVWTVQCLEPSSEEGLQSQVNSSPRKGGGK